MSNLIYVCLAVIVICVAAMVVMVRSLADALRMCQRAPAAQGPARTGDVQRPMVRTPYHPAQTQDELDARIDALIDDEPAVNIDALAARHEAGYAALMSAGEDR